MKGIRPVISAVVLLAATIACESSITMPTTLPLGPFAPIELAGGESVLSVGQSTQMSATVNGQPGDVVWESSSPESASVDASGRVTCLRGGLVVITARLRTDSLKFASRQIECRAAPLDVVISPESVEFEHLIGLSPCPHRIFGVILTNREREAVTVTTTSSHGALSSVQSATVPPGGHLAVPVIFDCSDRSPIISGTITITVRTADGREHTMAFRVRGLVY